MCRWTDQTGCALRLGATYLVHTTIDAPVPDLQVLCPDSPLRRLEATKDRQADTGSAGELLKQYMKDTAPLECHPCSC
jgi:hypothetical protein